MGLHSITRRGLLVAAAGGVPLARAWQGSVGAARAGQPSVDVRQTGAAGDGSTLDTAHIQRAIDQCAAAGGGEVVFPPGRYLTGTARLRDRVTLSLADGATILGSTRLDDYPAMRDSVASYTSNYTERCLIRAEGVSDVGIRGNGAIDGNGEAFQGPYKVRPYLLRFISCRGVRMSGITLRNSAMWVQHYLDSEDVWIDGVRVRSRRSRVNNDGIDIDSCRRVRISNCDIDCGDDAIVLKATMNKPCQDVVVANCILSTLCNAFKLGTESEGGFDNIVFSNSAIYDTRLAGIALETVDGGSLSRVAISNIVMRNVACPIFIRLGDRARPVSEGAPRPGVGSLAGVSIRGVDATATSPVGCSITGLPEHPAEDISIEGLRVVVPGGGTASAGELSERPEAYPEFAMFGALPAYGLYCRHVRNLALGNVFFRAAAVDARPALVADDSVNLSVTGFEGSDRSTARALIELRDARGARIRQTRAARQGQALAQLSGSRTSDVAIASDEARAPEVVTGAEVPRGAWRVVR